MERTLDADWVRDFGLRYAAAWNVRDPDRVAELLDEDIVWREPSLGEPARGLPAVVDVLEKMWRAFPDHRVQFLPWLEDPFISADGGACSVSWVSTGRFTGFMVPPGLAPTGLSFELDGIEVWRFRNERLLTAQSFYDVLGLCRQIGLFPARGSVAEQVAVHLQRLTPMGLTLLRKGA
ncbi:MAG: ester cyclase [Actinomycetota bacterium]